MSARIGATIAAREVRTASAVIGTCAARVCTASAATSAARCTAATSTARMASIRAVSFTCSFSLPSARSSISSRTCLDSASRRSSCLRMAAATRSVTFRVGSTPRWLRTGVPEAASVTSDYGWTLLVPAPGSVGVPPTTEHQMGEEGEETGLEPDNRLDAEAQSVGRGRSDDREHDQDDGGDDEDWDSHWTTPGVGGGVTPT